MKIQSRSVTYALLAWYDRHRRDLPWRNTPDPYRVWISEIMLQQTRVDAVTSYYERWLQAFPDIRVLAGAPLQAVLKQWEGLGYYARARNLHRAARLVCERHGGVLPHDVAALRALPGIGEYTAGAIASIAYGQPVAAVDANVRRVLARLYDVARPTPAATRARATQHLDPRRPGDFNQALMDLGATICTPRAPACGACPLNRVCRAHARGTTAKRPAPAARRMIPHQHVTTLAVLRDGAVLLASRTDHGMLGGLWEFPEVGELPAGARRLGSVTHTYSHKRITYTVHLSTTRRRVLATQQWVRLSGLRRYPLSAAQRKIERLLRSAVDRRLDLA